MKAKWAEPSPIVGTPDRHAAHFISGKSFKIVCLHFLTCAFGCTSLEINGLKLLSFKKSLNRMAPFTKKVRGRDSSDAGLIEEPQPIRESSYRDLGLHH
jgi:hypothetical protein